MTNKNLISAKRAKNDEFYTQYADIEKEIEAYLEYDPDTFRGKVVYCNCDDPYERNFFRYFVLNFDKLGLRKLITTCYKNQERDLFSQNASEKAIYLEYKGDKNKNRVPDPEEIGIQHLKGDGDFRSKECIELLKQADIVVTNPPFSLFREYVRQLVDYDKRFVIIGNMNAITYKEIFPLIKDNKMWLGNGFSGGNACFYIPNAREFASGVYDSETSRVKFGNIVWFTNLDHGHRHQPLPLMTMAGNKKFNKKIQKNENSYKKYDNYDAIEVPYTNAIPSDYDDVMGVPISFLDKYCPDQFEILGSDYNIKEGLLPKLVNSKWAGKLDRGYVNNKRLYTRIFIRHRKKQP